MSNISSKISLGCLHFGSLLNEKISENIILESWEKGVKNLTVVHFMVRENRIKS